MRIATWNLERPRRNDTRLEALRAKISDIDADVWILTETTTDVIPSSIHHAAATQWLGKPFKETERRTTIWSRYPIVSTVASLDSDSTVGVEIDVQGIKIIVYGTVLPYHSAGTLYPYRVGGETHQDMRNWELHYDSIAWHEAALKRTRNEYPNHEIIFGGDLNQSRDKRETKRYQYGTKKGRQLLTDMLSQNGLRCLTDRDFVASGDLTCRSSIDHLCVSSGLKARDSEIRAWDAPEVDDDPISDHNGVYVDLAL